MTQIGLRVKMDQESVRLSLIVVVLTMEEVYKRILHMETRRYEFVLSVKHNGLQKNPVNEQNSFTRENNIHIFKSHCNSFFYYYCVTLKQISENLRKISVRKSSKSFGNPSETVEKV